MGALSVRAAIDGHYAHEADTVLRWACWPPYDSGSAREWARRADAVHEPLPVVSCDDVTASDDNSPAASAASGGLGDPASLLRLGIEHPGLSSRRASELLGRQVAAHCPIDARAVAWGWPLRVTALDSHVLGELSSLQSYRQLYDVVEVPEVQHERYDIMVVDPAQVMQIPSRVWPTVVVVRSTEVDLALLDHAVGQLGAGAVLFTGRPVGDWFSGLIAQLSHDNPLDVALAMSELDAVLFADWRQLQMTSLRVLVQRWRQQVFLWDGTDVTVPDPGQGVRYSMPTGATVSAPEFADDLVRIATTYAFEMERGTGTTEANGSRALEAAGVGRIELEIRLDLTASAAGPPEAEEPPPPPPPAAPTVVPRPTAPTGQPPGGLPMTGPGRGGEPETVAAARYLNVSPAALDADGAELDNEVTAFVAGAPYRISVAVRERRARGALSLMAALPEPTPGRATTLTITVFQRGRIDTAQSKPLDLPARGDTGWCTFDVVAPVGAQQFDLVVVVYHDNALQVGVVSGPIVATAADLPAVLAWTFNLGSAGDFGGGSPTPAILVDDAAFARLDLGPGMLSPTAVTAGKARMRQRILQALEAETSRPKLAKLSPVLADLAIDGRLMRDQLLGAGPSSFDTAERVRVASIEAGDPLPLEALYDHAAPVDNTVKLCQPARDGAATCTLSCADRNNAQVVCPFGFWGISKSIERVRAPRPAAEARPMATSSLAITSSALVGICERASNKNTSAARKILKAFRGLVGRANLDDVWTWDDWDRAVASSPRLLALVTHTEQADGRPALEIGPGVLRPIHQVTAATINPTGANPGPLVLLLGCDTAHLETAYTDLVDRIHAVGAEIVVAVQTPVRGAQVAELVDAMVEALRNQVSAPGTKRMGEVLRATRHQLLLEGRIAGLAVVSTGDGGIELS